MQSYCRERTWSKIVECEKNYMKKNSVCLPSENLFQILPKSGYAFV
jgi:hypothetical protein